MFAMELHVDGGAFEGRHRNPTIAQIERAIDTLDGKKCTSVTISGPDEEPWLCVGGGNDARYVVVFQQDAMHHWILEDGRINKVGHVPVVCGFQAGDFPANQAIGKDLALASARAFAQSGVRSEEWTWRFTGRK
jgi:hypothetical protein